MGLHSSPNLSLRYNTSEQTTEENDFVPTPADIGIAVSIIDGASILFGAAINLAVIVVILRNHRKLKTMDLFVLNLCISDFISTTFYQPQIIIRLLARSELGKLQSSFFRMATFTCLLADCAALFLVTFDKYVGIRYPLRYRMYLSKKKVVVIITCAWIIAASVGLTFAIIEESGKIAGILYALLILIMFITTTVLQIASFFIAKRHERRIQNMEMQVVGNYSSSRKSETTDKIGSNEEQKAEITQITVYNSMSAHRLTSKAARTITILSAVFIISWLPQIVLNVYFIITFDRNTFFHVIYIFVAFQQLHVCINPFIYVFRTQCIRNRFFGKIINIGSYSGTEY